MVITRSNVLRLRADKAARRDGKICQVLKDVDTLLTQSELLRIIEYDINTGIFYWKIKNGHAQPGKIAGTQKDGYWKIRIAGFAYYAHRLAWLYVYGDWPVDQIDHINRDKLDNKIRNLRPCSRSQNKANSSVSKNNICRIKGVRWARANRKWSAQIRNGGKTYNLGYFDDKNSAARAYIKAAKSAFGEFA